VSSTPRRQPARAAPSSPFSPLIQHSTPVGRRSARGTGLFNSPAPRSPAVRRLLESEPGSPAGEISALQGNVSPATYAMLTAPPHQAEDDDEEEISELHGTFLHLTES